eukprot:CAMPEP_0184543734 /NCGR_PEP_ID=MMETSP0199_2-20130426/3146_1 /TAXON_ID=1112570 /ORGANISM="Thraustochytrium sp., Strain LLF1b" /LENGTH=460 /DNA_ID=CAMNT_0026937807 /DNA_START=31 /DNA_END=1413 /DNA_ORIENTATION=+
METDSEDEHGGEQIRVQFVTEHDEFKITETSIAVPVALGRAGLSEIVNHLLARDPPVPFDFLVKDKDVLVRKRLLKVVEELELSSEDVLVLEYAPAVQQPDLQAESEWPDWISCIDASATVDGMPLVWCGSYDGAVQASVVQSSPESGDSKLTVVPVDKITPGKSGQSAIKGVRQFGSGLLATACKDGTVGLFQTNVSQGPEGPALQYSQLASCKGHSGSVETIDGIQLGDFAVLGTGGWDHEVCLWKLRLGDQSSSDDDEDGEQPNAKSRRVGSADAASKQSGLRIVEEPSSSLIGHTDNVSAVCWEAVSAPTILYSGSWDHSIRAWDVTRETSSMELVGGKVVTALDHSSQNNMLASGHPDNAVRLWDSRTTGDSVVRLQLRSHRAWVSCVKWCPTNSNLLISAAHDRTVKVWDIRSTKPLHTLEEHQNKVLAVDWSKDGKQIVSGGADSILRAYVAA